MARPWLRQPVRDDTVVSGLGWIEAMARLAAAQPRTAVPGHGDIDGTQVLEDVLGYLRERAMRPGRKRHPERAAREWIATAVTHPSIGRARAGATFRRWSAGWELRC